MAMRSEIRVESFGHFCVGKTLEQAAIFWHLAFDGRTGRPTGTGRCLAMCFLPERNLGLDRVLFLQEHALPSSYACRGQPAVGQCYSASVAFACPRPHIIFLRLKKLKR